MRITTFSLLLFALCASSVPEVKGQDTSPSDKKETTIPASAPTPASPQVINLNDQPEFKSYFGALQERDLVKRLAAFEKFIAAFPNSSYTTAAHLQLLYGVIKIAPADKERIYQQALKTLASVETAYPLGSADSISATYNSVAKALYDAEMDDRAAETAHKGIALIDEVNAQTIFRANSGVVAARADLFAKKRFEKG